MLARYERTSLFGRNANEKEKKSFYIIDRLSDFISDSPTRLFFDRVTHFLDWNHASQNNDIQHNAIQNNNKEKTRHPA